MSTAGALWNSRLGRAHWHGRNIRSGVLFSARHRDWQPAVLGIGKLVNAEQLVASGRGAQQDNQSDPGAIEKH
jgi:hypothetical protein